MIKILTTSLLILAFMSIGSPVVANEVQISQVNGDGEALRAAKEAEYGESRKLDDEKNAARDAQDKAKQGLHLDQEESERGERAAESEQNRQQRKSRLKALIEK